VIIDGRDVLLTQVLRQFQIMTGKRMSAPLARATLDRRESAAKLLSAPADAGRHAAAGMIAT